MAVWGKVLGAFFGFLLGGPFGLLLGLFLGNKFDKARQGISFSGGFGGARQQVDRQAYFYATFAVMGHVAKAKGKVTKSEIRLATLLMEKMALDANARRQAQDAFRDGKENTFPLEDVVKSVRQSCGGRFDLLQMFLEVQIQAAYADGQLDNSELQILYLIAHHLGFSRFQLERIIAMQEAAFHFQHQNTNRNSGNGPWSPDDSASRRQDAYKVLGVAPDANTQTVKRAYRKLMNEHHPDKLAARGLPPEMREMAKQKAQEIQAAYDMIKKG